MKAVCSFCGELNSGTAAACSRCGQSLAGAQRVPFRLPWGAWVGAVLVSAVLGWVYLHETRVRSEIVGRLQRELADLNRTRTETMAEMEAGFRLVEEKAAAAHQARMTNGALLSGELARARHKEEWAAREAHDPKFVASLLEKMLLEVEALGKDPATRAEEALREVASRVAPQGSRVEVTPKGDRFNVRVAFRLGAVMPQEEGLGTKHSSATEMRGEIEDVCARLMQYLFDFCGTRGIDKLSVSCNRVLREKLLDEDRLKMKSLYRASIDAETAGSVVSWRQTPVAQIVPLMKVERDIISTITITHGESVPAQLDPNEPLEF